ncbi:hypothetical protein DMENIID0001_129490 [Sergentomyia squamirostris]
MILCDSFLPFFASTTFSLVFYMPQVVHGAPPKMGKPPPLERQVSSVDVGGLKALLHADFTHITKVKEAPKEWSYSMILVFAPIVIEFICCAER